MMDLRPELGFSGKIWAILLGYGPLPRGSKKKDAAIYLLTKQISKIILTIFDKDILKDFQKIFQSRPIPGLYLKRFRS